MEDFVSSSIVYILIAVLGIIPVLSSVAMTSRYCIIGAGVSGLACARYALETGGTVIVFEQSSQIGGTWVYTDRTGLDSNGIPIHTGMYRDLRTNLPKEAMGFRDFDIDNPQLSYVPGSDVLQFIERFSQHYSLQDNIRLEHQVLRVTRLFDCNKWEVIVKELRTGTVVTHVFDFVLVCNGHFFSPRMPDINGAARFGGQVLHSHDYRYPERFTGKDVLLIGSGPSGVDIAIALEKTANSVTISHHSKHPLKVPSPGIVQKPDVRELTPTGVRFVDGTEWACNVVMYCTGYRYSFPFLSTDCGISVDENHVEPLYKHCININQPTMALIGIPFNSCATQMIDLQARFCLKFFSGAKALPTRSTMFNDMLRDVDERKRRAIPRRHMHKLVDDLQERYYEELASCADVQPMKPIVMKVYYASTRRKAECLVRYRDDIFLIEGDDYKVQ